MADYYKVIELKTWLNGCKTLEDILDKISDILFFLELPKVNLVSSQEEINEGFLLLKTNDANLKNYGFKKDEA